MSLHRNHTQVWYPSPSRGKVSSGLMCGFLLVSYHFVRHRGVGLRQRINRGMDAPNIAIALDGRTIGGRPPRAAKFLGAEESLAFSEPGVSTPTVHPQYVIYARICSRSARKVSQFGVSVFTITCLPVGRHTFVTPTTNVAAPVCFCHSSRET